MCVQSIRQFLLPPSPRTHRIRIPSPQQITVTSDPKLRVADAAAGQHDEDRQTCERDERPTYVWKVCPSLFRIKLTVVSRMHNVIRLCIQTPNMVAYLVGG